MSSLWHPLLLLLSETVRSTCSVTLSVSDHEGDDHDVETGAAKGPSGMCTSDYDFGPEGAVWVVASEPHHLCKDESGVRKVDLQAYVIIPGPWRPSSS